MLEPRSRRPRSIPSKLTTVVDPDGEILIEHTRPALGVTYAGNGRPRGPRPKKTDEHTLADRA